MPGVINMLVLAFCLRWVIGRLGGYGLLAMLLGATRGMGSLIPRDQPAMSEAEFLRRRRDEEERLRLEDDRRTPDAL